MDVRLSSPGDPRITNHHVSHYRNNISLLTIRHSALGLIQWRSLPLPAITLVSRNPLEVYIVLLVVYKYPHRILFVPSQSSEPIVASEFVPSFSPPSNFKMSFYLKNIELEIPQKSD